MEDSLFGYKQEFLKKKPQYSKLQYCHYLLKAKDESSNWLSKPHSTLAALTPTKLFVEMFEISRKYFFSNKKPSKKK